MNPDFESAIKETYAVLSSIDYETLQISDYNKQYIGRLKPSLRYYLTIYSYCMHQGLRDAEVLLSDMTMIDFGGGSGFLSIYAKKLGIGNVIYVDLNPLSVATVQLLKERTGVGPDVILHGSSDVLAAWCSERSVLPDFLVATDLIEHVYDLDTFFDELTGINDRMRMLFTTGSTPYNPYVKRRLHRMMLESEYGVSEFPNYYAKRKEYIRRRFALISEQEIESWTLKTRGLTYADMDNAIENNYIPPLPGAYNTCDPETGNWTERILPVKSYRRMLLKHAYTVSVYKGFYNIRRSRKWQSAVFRLMNWFIRISGKAGFLFSPFILLVCDRKKISK